MGQRKRNPISKSAEDSALGSVYLFFGIPKTTVPARILFPPPLGPAADGLVCYLKRQGSSRETQRRKESWKSVTREKSIMRTVGLEVERGVGLAKRNSV